MSLGDFEAITGADDSRIAFDTLRENFSLGGQRFRDHSVGFQGGSRRCEVFWYSRDCVWGLFESTLARGRFWNCFGVQDPHVVSGLTITVEINPPMSGINRRVAGAFVCDVARRVYIAHSGKVGGGRPGIGLKAFRQFAAAKKWETISWPDGRRSEAIIVAPVQGLETVSRIADFVREVARFKEAVAGR